eukprot:c20748_g1_i1.p1 GENE.c20748_g1_i1~~c20748_g1_i1.p1  ORF type:complete len:600 (+),score=138.30 c20748_g1_i1:279-2078(+)
MWSLPSCGHCKKFLPEFAKAAEWILREETAHQFIAFAKVNAHQAPTLTARYGILSYPTLQLFRGGNTPPETIQIGRSQRAIVQYVNKLFSLSLPVPQRSSRLRNSAVLDATDDFEKLLDEHLSEYVSVVVLWSSASKQSDLLRAEYERIGRWCKSSRDPNPSDVNSFRVLVWSVDAAERQDLAAKFEIKTFPSISAFPSTRMREEKGVESIEWYDTTADKNPVITLSAFKVAEWIERVTGFKAHPTLPPSPAVTCMLGVPETTDEDFENVIDQREFTLLMAYAPWCGHCKAFSAAYQRIFDALKPFSDRISVVKANTDTHKSIANKLGVQGFPTFFVFDRKAAKWHQFEGSAGEEDLIEFVNKIAGLRASTLVVSPAVVRLNDESFHSVILDPFKDVLVMFYAPWCPHCQRALPEFELLAQSMHGNPLVNVTVAILDAVQYKDQARQYGGTHRYPTVELFPKGNKDGVVPAVYMGPLTSDHMVAYLNEITNADVWVCGHVGESMGRIEGLSDRLAAAWANSDFDEAAAEIERVEHFGAAEYAKLLRRISEKGPGFVDTELERIDRMLKSHVTKPKRILLTSRRNILQHISRQRTGLNEF